MKIVSICEFFPVGKELRFSGGVEARTYFVFKNLVKKNDVHVITTRIPGSSSFEKIQGINIHRVGPAKSYRASASLSQIFLLSKFILSAIKTGKSLNPDIVEGTNFITHFIAKQVSRKIKTPVVYWYPDVFIGNWLKSAGIGTGLLGAMLEKINIISSADKFISISKSTKSKLINQNVSSSKISIVPCGVESKEFNFKISKSAEPNIICVSRFVSYKRVTDLVWAFAKVRQRIPKLKLILVGRGPQENKIKEIIKVTKNTNNVKIYANLGRKQLISLIKTAKLSCLPSEVEGFGISLIESAAAGTPYVCSNIGVLKEVTKNGKGGLLFESGSILDLATKIEKLLTSESLFKQKVAECHNLAEIYNWEKISKQTESIYKSLI